MSAYFFRQIMLQQQICVQDFYICLFDCNRGDTMQYHNWLQTRKLGQAPILVFLIPRMQDGVIISPAQSFGLSILVWSLLCICYCYSSKCVSVFLHQTLVIPWFSKNNQTVSKLNADAGSLYNTVKQASGPQVIRKTHPPTCLD